MSRSYAGQFLEEYRKLEAVLRKAYGRDMSVRNYEDADEGESEKVRVCRNLRNFISHNPDPDAVIPVPKETVQYVRGLREEIEKSLETAGGPAVRAVPLKPESTLREAGKKLVKYPAVPVTGGGGSLVGIITRESFASLIAGGAEPGTRLGSLGKGALGPDRTLLAKSSEPYADVRERLRAEGALIILDSAGKYFGILMDRQH